MKQYEMDKKLFEKIKSELLAIQDFLKDKQLCIVITKNSIECLSPGDLVKNIDLNKNDK